MSIFSPAQPAIERSVRPAPSTATNADLPALDTASLRRLPAKLQWSLLAAYRIAGRYDEAAALLDAIEHDRGGSVKSLEERARLAFAAGRLDEAESALKARLAQAPSNSAKVALARFYLESGRHDEARQLSDALIAAAPEMQTVTVLAADIARATGDRAAARAHHESVLARQPEHVGSLLALAALTVDDGGRSEAVCLIDRALDDDGLSIAQLEASAALAAQLNQPERAASLLARAAEQIEQRRRALESEIAQALGRPRPNTVAAAHPAVPRTEGRANESTIRKTPDEPDRPEPVAVIASGEEPVVDPTVIEMLQRDFGLRALRPGQAAVIANVLADRDTLAIMPTGAGKSLTFQLPAMLRDGTTLVISPLIALMKDQVDNLPPPVRAKTTLVNSTLSADEQRRVLDQIAGGEFKLIYAAPERLRQHTFLRAMRQSGVSLVVVDEAHCVSMWGHDFRPDYLTIPIALPELGNPTLLAMTATATPRTAGSIQQGLGRQMETLRSSVFRPNLSLSVVRVANREAKVREVVEQCRRLNGSGIVYVSSRNDAERVAAVLRDRGVSAVPYHAGLDPRLRAANQQRFMRGQARVVVATVAFGMGVNKRDVRFIIHLTPPSSLEAYAQESGRAGRDGRPARCILLTAPQDQASLNRLARRDELDLDTIRRVYAGISRAARGGWAIVDPSRLVPVIDDEDADGDPRIAIGLLSEAGMVRRHPDAPLTLSVRRLADGESGDAAPIDGDDATTWWRFAAWSGLDQDSAVTVRTVEACAALDLSPEALTSLLAKLPTLAVREGNRAVCLELLPAGDDARIRLERVLDRQRIDARARIAQVFAYINDASCRHQALARHLGERLDPCGTACDVCTGAVFIEPAVERTTANSRGRATAADAAAILSAVETLPFPMGKTGLIRLLAGSVESRVRGDRSPSFGALSDLSQGAIGKLIDRLVDDGLLDRDLDHEFKLISLTARGRAVTEADLADYESAPRATPRRAGDPAASGDASEHWTVENDELFERLKSWRRQRASHDAMPPYVIAHDATLRDVAVAQPMTLRALANIKGFGPAKIERYGDEILAVVNGSAVLSA